MVAWNQRFIERFFEMSAVLYDSWMKKAVSNGKMSTSKHLMLSKSLWQKKYWGILKKIEKQLSLSFQLSRKKAHKMGDRGGMSAILAQTYQDGWHPIYFASRRLTDVESRWGRGVKQSLKPSQLNGEQQRNLVNFLLALQHSRYLQMKEFGSSV